MPPNRTHEVITAPSALADATAGAIGSVLATATFYPLDVLKVKVQASLEDGRRDVEKTDRRAIGGSLLALILRSGSGLFRGLGAKSAHTVASSFVYFYIYSSAKARYRRARGGSGSKISPTAGLVLAALSAMMNTAVTMPLDVLVTRRQTEDGGRGGKTAGDSAEAVADPLEGTKRLRIGDLWSGLAPALMLSSNPAIQYTVYDECKSALLKFKRGSGLSMAESFLIGTIAKIAATLITYPLIRAKVLMMMKVSEDSLEEGKPGARNNVAGGGGTSAACRSRLSTLAVLGGVYRNGGALGLYKGLSLQLLHTVLKSAFMMMMRERIGRAMGSA